jgi:hypothetical protein
VSIAFRKPMSLVHYSVDPTSRRPSRSAGAAITVKGAVRHRLDDRLEDAGQIVKQEHLVYLPPGTVITDGDELTYDGDTWVVVGNPFEAWNQRTNTCHHLEVRVRGAQR